MNDPATPPSSASPIDRFAEMAEGLRRSLDEEGGGGLGNVLFVVIVVHFLLRLASLCLRCKAELLASDHSDTATPNAAQSPASPKRASGAARAHARENMGGVRADDRHSRALQDRDADIATVTAVVAPRPGASAAGYRIYRRTSPGAPCAAGAFLAGYARFRPPQLSMARGAIVYACLFCCDIVSKRDGCGVAAVRRGAARSRHPRQDAISSSGYIGRGRRRHGRPRTSDWPGPMVSTRMTREVIGRKNWKFDAVFSTAIL